MMRTRLILTVSLGVLTILLFTRLGRIDVSPDTVRRIRPGLLLAPITVHSRGDRPVRGRVCGTAGPFRSARLRSQLGRAAQPFH
jgi:hypothetical protein